MEYSERQLRKAYKRYCGNYKDYLGVLKGSDDLDFEQFVDLQSWEYERMKFLLDDEEL